LCREPTDDGIELVKELSSKDVIKNIGVPYTSFQTKALEMAVLLAKPNAIPIKADNGLTEAASITGPFEKDFDIYTKNIYDYYTDTVERVSGGEAEAEALECFDTTLEAIAKAEED
jgi:hypothetical protein